jgi:phage shock protein PspC (stress-responsive transcriptional regulator)
MSITTSPVLQRPRNGRILAGVCAGLANRFGWDANLVRLLFVLSFLLPGPQFIAYIIMWIVIPNEPLPTQVQAPAPREPTV